MRTRTTIFMLLVSFMLSSAAFGQRVTGSIDGRVSDVSGAVLPGVEITVTNDSTGETRATITNEIGLYNIPLLRSGTYSVQASLPGFRTELRSGVLVEVDRTARIQIQLQVGMVTETVEVTADVPLVQTDNSALGQVIDAQRVAQLPLNGRNFLDLASLTPGVVPFSEGSNFATRGGTVSVNGAREVFNNFMLDGVDNNDAGPASIIISPSPDSIQEFKVQTNSTSAEYGRAVGGLINVTTKSGSNQYHGTVYEYLRNSAMDAKNFFDPADKKKPSFKRNQFGATVGGPIARNRTFFFFAWERTIVRKPEFARARVPETAWRNGDFSSVAKDIIDPKTGAPFPGNIIPKDRFHPIGKGMMDLYPLPNASGVNNLVSLSNFTIDQDNIASRFDHTFSEKDSMYVRYSISNRPNLQPYTRNSNQIAGWGVKALTLSQSIVISEAHIFSPNVVSEVRIGFARLHYKQEFESQDHPAIKTLAVPGTRVYDEDLRKEWMQFPQVTLSGFTGIPSGGTQLRYDNHYDYIANVSWTKGAHQMKMGFEGRRAHNHFHSPSTANGGYRFDNRYTGFSVADLLLGHPSRVNTSKGWINGYGRTWHFSGFYQDDWRVTPQLTLNLGLRYEYQTNGHHLRDRKAIFDTTTGLVKMAGEGPPHPTLAPVLAKYPGIAIKDGTVSRSGWNDDFNNFGPRIGFAYDVTGDGKTVIRGGGGVFYITQPGGSGAGYWTNAYAFPFQLHTTINGSTNARNPDIDLFKPFPDSAPGLRARSADVDMRTPYMTQQNLSIARQLDETTVIEVTYAGTKGNKLYRYRDINAAPLGAGGKRPFPRFSAIRSIEGSSSSVYHSLQLRFDRRLSRGVSVLGAYTYSKSIDDESAQSGRVSGGAPQNYYNLKEQRGPSVFDRPQSMSAAFVWEVPFGRDLTGIAGALIQGWQINGIYSFASGQPYTPTLQGDNSGTKNRQDRPDLIGQWKLSDPDPNRWVNEAAFSIPPKGSFGNAGRNVLRGPGTNNLDFSIGKTFAFGEMSDFAEFRCELFNLPNHPQFYLPNRFVNSKQFGTVPRARDGRQIQMSLRFTF